MTQEPRSDLARSLSLALVGLVQICVVGALFGKSSASIVYLMLVASGSLEAMLAIGALLGIVYLAAAIAPIVGVFARRFSLPVRIGLVLAPFVVGGLGHIAALALRLPGVYEPDPEPPPAGCVPTEHDPSARLRPCDPTPRDKRDPFAGSCPHGFTCREPSGRHGPPACYVACTHDCMCPSPARCVNAACRWPGDPIP